MPKGKKGLEKPAIFTAKISDKHDKLLDRLKAGTGLSRCAHFQAGRAFGLICANWVARMTWRNFDTIEELGKYYLELDEIALKDPQRIWTFLDTCKWRSWPLRLACSVTVSYGETLRHGYRGIAVDGPETVDRFKRTED